MFVINVQGVTNIHGFSFTTTLIKDSSQTFLTSDIDKQHKTLSPANAIYTEMQCTKTDISRGCSMYRKTRRIVTGATLAASSAISLGAGFQVGEHSASGLGRAFAGEAAFADNAAVIAANPAAMNHFKTMQISAQVTAILPAINVEDKTHGQKAEGIAPSAIVPGLYYIAPVNDTWSFGLGLYTNYGVTTKYPKDWIQGDNAGETGLKTVNFSPNFAFRLYEGLSFGFAVDLVYADADLTRYVGGLAPAFNASPEDELVSMTGDTTAWGWNAGLFYEINENHRLGLSYTAEVNLDFDGTFIDGTGSIVPGQAGVKLRGQLPLILPATAEFSGYHDIDTSWAIHYSINWTQWSKFTEISATNPSCMAPGLPPGTCFLKEEDYQDNWRYAVGSTVKLNEEWLFRFGIAYDERAGQPTLSIPDADRYWVSAGTTWQFTDHQSVDLGMSYLFSATNDFSETSLTGTAQFEASGYATLWGIQYNYGF